MQEASIMQAASRACLLSSQTSVDFHQNTQHYIPEEINPHSHRCENLKSYTIKFIYFVPKISIPKDVKYFLSFLF
jgi:hypothetical protein